MCYRYEVSQYFLYISNYYLSLLKLRKIQVTSHLALRNEITLQHCNLQIWSTINGCCFKEVLQRSSKILQHSRSATQV